MPPPPYGPLGRAEPTRESWRESCKLDCDAEPTGRVEAGRQADCETSTREGAGSRRASAVGSGGGARPMLNSRRSA
eukprot:2944663-Prymnesium_polylepis.1